jgi:hypothetical protein
VEGGAVALDAAQTAHDGVAPDQLEARADEPRVVGEERLGERPVAAVDRACVATGQLADREAIRELAQVSVRSAQRPA